MTPLTGLIGMGGGATSHRFYTASSEESYQIEKSLRLSFAEQSYLNKTFSSSNARTWTFNCWYKSALDMPRHAVDRANAIFGCRPGSSNDTTFAIRIETDYTIKVGTENETIRRTTQVFRDPGAWQMLTFVMDTSNDTTADRFRMYVNGEQVTDFSSSDAITQNREFGWNKAGEMNIGRMSSLGYYPEQLMADVQFIDGLALSPAAFGSLDSTGLWNPKAFALPVPNDGRTWSSNISNSTTPANAVDGNLATNSGGSANSITTFVFDPPLTNVVEFDHYTNDSGVHAIAFNDGNFEWDSGGSGQWRPTIPSIPSTISKVEIQRGGGFGTDIRAVRANGVILVDGQTDETYTQWAASTSDNVNSFHLKFDDTSSNAALGTDSLLSNDFTVNNLVATDSSNPENIDSLVDSPTNYLPTDGDDALGGVTRGNYATLNPLQCDSNITLKNGNLQFDANSNHAAVAATLGIRTGKWYWEMTKGDGDNHPAIGIKLSSLGQATITNSLVGNPSFFIRGMETLYLDGTEYAGGVMAGYTQSDGETIGFAFDADAGKIWARKVDGSWANSGDPANGTGAVGTGFHTDLDGSHWLPVTKCYNGTGHTMNFGARAFENAAPTGFKSLCTTNLDDTFGANDDALEDKNNPSKYFDIKTYTGNGGTNSVKDVGFQPELIWTKSRSAATDHLVFDRVRSDAGNIYDYLKSNDPGGQATGGTTSLTAYNSDGFTMGADGAMNASNETFVAWMWDAGTTSWSSSDNDVNAGSFASSGYTNRTAGFSIVTYEGDQANNTTGTIGHNLGVAPKFIIVKNYDGHNKKWLVGHKDIASGAWTHHLYLDDDDPETGSSAARWNNTPPTQDVFSVGDTSYANATGNSHIAYCWAPIAGYSSFGSYTGNASATGPFIYTGFDTKWLMIKRTDATKGWMMIDSTRNPNNLVRGTLYPHANYAEHTGTGHGIDLLSNGFKIREDNDRHNASGGEYVYMAFAEHPFKVSRAR